MACQDGGLPCTLARGLGDAFHGLSIVMAGPSGCWVKAASNSRASMGSPSRRLAIYAYTHARCQDQRWPFFCNHEEARKGASRALPHHKGNDNTKSRVALV